MNLPLRVRWQKQLDAAQTSSSWGARVEARVLRFLLARYAGSSEEAPLPKFPLYEGEAAPGRARMLLSPRDQNKRLSHIEQGNLERIETPDWVSNESLEHTAWQEVRERRRQEAVRQFGQAPPPPQVPKYGPEWLQFRIAPFTYAHWKRMLSTTGCDTLLSTLGPALKFLVGVVFSRH